MEDVYKHNVESEEEEEDWSQPLDQAGPEPGGMGTQKESPNLDDVTVKEAFDGVPCDTEPTIATSHSDDSHGQLSSKIPAKPELVKGNQPIVMMSSSNGTSHTEGALLTRMQLNDNKAGMEGLDRERINKIIYEASKGSRYYENEQKKEQQVTVRIEEQNQRLNLLTPQQISMGTSEADLILGQLETSRNLSHLIVHVDMDAFYAAVEMRDNPSVRNIPMAVGGTAMLSTSNYLARRFGVRAAMPGFIAKKLCPSLVIVPVNFDKYIAVSKQIRAIMSEYDPNFCPMSLDEAYLDFTHHVSERATSTDEARMFLRMPRPEELCQCCPGAEPATKTKQQNDQNVAGSSQVKSSTTYDQRVGHSNLKGPSMEPAENDEIKDEMCCSDCGRRLSTKSGIQQMFGLSIEDAVQEMRERIYWETKLTASAGIASNTMLAKVCSDRNKPNGQYRIPSSRDAVMSFIDKLQIRKVSGIGKVSERMLSSIGVKTCSDLYRIRGTLYHLYSNVSFNHFLRVSIGIGSTTVERDGERKSMSTERTFTEIHQPAELYKKCLELCEALAGDLRKEQLLGKTVGIKLKTVKFDLKTRAQTLLNPTNDAEQIYAAASDLLRTEIQLCRPEPLRLRLMGVRLSNLVAQSTLGDQRQSTITSLLQRMQTKVNKPQLPMNPGHTDTSEETACFTGDGMSTGCSKNQARSLVQVNDTAPKVLPESVSEIQTKMGHVGNRDNATGNDGNLKLRSGRVAVRGSMFTCPICNKNMTLPSLESFNGHIDTCLQTTDEATSLIPPSNKPAADVSEHNLEMKQIKNPEAPSIRERFLGSSYRDMKNSNQSDTVKWKNDAVIYKANDRKNSVVMHDQGLGQWAKLEPQTTTELPTLKTHANEGKVQYGEKINSDSAALDLIPCTKLISTTQINFTGDVPEGKTVSSTNLLCPVCNQIQILTNPLQFNLHIDECLGMIPPSVQDTAPATDHAPSTSDVPHDSLKKLTNQEMTKTSPSLFGIQKDISQPTAEESRAEEKMPSEKEDRVDRSLCCPVCNIDKQDLTLEAFNQHVDTCLTKQAIKEILQSDRHQAQSTKRSHASNQGPVPKRKKTTAGIRTIDSFFT